MTDTKNEASERIWSFFGYVCEEQPKPVAGTVGVEYVRADLLADMTRQRDEARDEGFAAGLEAAAKVAGSLLVRARFGTGEIATEVVYSDFVAAAINALAEGAKT